MLRLYEEIGIKVVYAPIHENHSYVDGAAGFGEFERRRHGGLRMIFPRVCDVCRTSEIV